MAFKLGFVGVGSIARHHAKAALSLGAEICSAVSRHPGSPNWQAFARVAPDCRHAESLEALLRDDSLDGYVGCASWDVMPDIAAALLETGKPVLLEKPVALSLGSALRLAEKAEDKSNCVVGYNRRFFAPVAALKEAIERQRPIGVSLRVCEPIHRQRDRFGPEIVANLLAFSSAHFVDTLLHLMGPVTIETLSAFQHEGPLHPFVSYAGTLRSRDGVPILFEVSAETPGPSELRVRFADEQCWVLSPMEQAAVYQGSIVREGPTEQSARIYEPNCIRRIRADDTFKPGIHEQMACFLSGADTPAATLQDAVAVMAFIEALKKTPTCNR